MSCLYPCERRLFIVICIEFLPGSSGACIGDVAVAGNSTTARCTSSTLTEGASVSSQT